MTEQAGKKRTTDKHIIDYRMFWRWHFYAGLFCIPFIIILSLTGPIYLFKPQIDAAIDAQYDHLSFSGPPQSANLAVKAALAAVPDGIFKSIEVRPDDHDALRIIVAKQGEKIRFYVHPKSLKILKQVSEEKRFMSVVKNIHGELLTGHFGQVIVELAASWAIVMILTGLYLWWPREAKGAAGLVYPRLNMGRRVFWRDIHAVTGLYVSGLALCLLLTGLPWTYVWGNGFKMVRSIGHRAPVEQPWSLVHEHGMVISGHDMMDMPMRLPPLDGMIEAGHALNLAAPVSLSAPAMGMGPWKLQSDSGNRTLRATVMIDSKTFKAVSRRDFKDSKVVDQVVSIGISAHEGQLFGPLNQVLGVLTALGLMTLCVSAVMMWWQRRPANKLGAPLQLTNERLAPGLAILIVGLGVFLPVLGISLIVVGLIEWLILRHVPRVRDWLGLGT